MTMKGNRPFQPPAPARPQLELQNRKILVGVTGGIAAYKAVELCRLFIKAGAKVQVVMTPSAAKFVAPLTFETVTGRTVFIEMYPEHGHEAPWHTEIATWADIAVVAPATANHLAKLAHGLADDLLSSLMLALERPRVLCPAMNPRMWANVATQENLGTLKRHGYRVILPDEGQMARPGEDEGIGRLAEPEAIYREIRHVLSAPQDLRGVRVLVTAGRTEESWDPVRVLTNRASGRMGFALAEEARERGADVMLVHGPTDVIPPTGVRTQRIITAAEMTQSVKREFPHCNILLMSAAVADYTFSNTAEHKIKKGKPDPEMKLIATEDILRAISALKGNRLIVGFALETENVLENALRKLREKHLDIVVANNPLERGSGFSGETNQVMIIHRTGRVQDLPLQSKREVAREILNAVIALYRHPEPEPEIEPELDLDIDEDADLLDDADEPGLLRRDELDLADAPAEPAGSAKFEPQDNRAESRSARRRRNRRRREEQQRQQQQHQKSAQPAPLATNGHKPETIAPSAEVKAELPKKPLLTVESPKNESGRPRVTVRPAPRPKESAAPPVPPVPAELPPPAPAAPEPVAAVKADDSKKRGRKAKPASANKADKAAKPKPKPAAAKTSKPKTAKPAKKSPKKKASAVEA